MKKSVKNWMLFALGTMVVILLALFRNNIMLWADDVLNKDVSIISTTGNILYIMLLSAMEFAIAGITVLNRNIKFCSVKKCAFAYLMVVLLMFSYNLDIFSRSITMFKGFQADSESLVAASMISEKYNLEEKYNLGLYRNILNNGNVEFRGQAFYDYAFTPYSDSEVADGYSVVTAGVMAVGKGDLARDVFLEGRTVQFADGTSCKVLYQEEKDNCIYIYTDYNELLTEIENGKLIDITVFDENGEVVSLHEYARYTSQFGLQGMVFRVFAKFLPLHLAYAACYLVCTLLAAVCIIAIVLLIAKRYNRVMAFCFYFVFLTAPTIVNYARNLYWVMFTWFVPMAIGLMVAVYFNNRKVKIAGVTAAFISILVKCLCGYEYISAILVSMMMFLFADFVVKCVEKNKSEAVEYFKVMVIMASAGLAGFATAILIHAVSLDMGSMSESIKYLWKYVIQKRTSGIDQPFSAISGIEVLKRYFKFDLDIIWGVFGEHFIKMALLPVAVFVYEFFRYRKIDITGAVIYVLGFAAALSWHMIAKEHSSVHYYMNIVLWYFGFVQICIYIPVNCVVKEIKKLKR